MCGPWRYPTTCIRSQKIINSFRWSYQLIIPPTLNGELRDTIRYTCIHLSLALGSWLDYLSVCLHSHIRTHDLFPEMQHTVGGKSPMGEGRKMPTWNSEPHVLSFRAMMMRESHTEPAHVNFLQWEWCETRLGLHAPPASAFQAGWIIVGGAVHECRIWSSDVCNANFSFNAWTFLKPKRAVSKFTCHEYTEMGHFSSR